MTTDNSLLDLRYQINLIDEKIVKLLAQRKLITIKIIQSKIINNKPIRDLNREKDLFKNLLDLSKKYNIKNYYIKKIFHVIIQYSIKIQEEWAKTHYSKNSRLDSRLVRFSFLGPIGSYSYLAAKQYSQIKNINITHNICYSFQDVINQVENHLSDLGILPIDNKCSGSITEVYDLLKTTDLFIIGELYLSVQHCLLANSTSTNIKNIKKIYSHTQPLLQCSKFIHNFPHWKIELAHSTSDAMKKLAMKNSNFYAALGNKEGAKLYNLKIVKNNLSNDNNNNTRFIIVSKTQNKLGKKTLVKTTFSIKLKNDANILLNILSFFQKNNITIKKIEYRPMENNLWKEIIFIDIKINLLHIQIKDIIKHLQSITSSFKILGCYSNINNHT